MRILLVSAWVVALAHGTPSQIDFSNGAQVIFEPNGEGNNTQTAKVTVTIPNDLCGSQPCQYFGLGIGGRNMAGTAAVIFVEDQTTAELCLAGLVRPPECPKGSQSTLAGSKLETANGKTSWTFNSKGLGGTNWSGSQSIFVHGGRGTSVGSMQQHPRTPQIKTAGITGFPGSSATSFSAGILSGAAALALYFI